MKLKKIKIYIGIKTTLKLKKRSYILILKILYFVSNSVKCILCRLTIERLTMRIHTYICSMYKVDYRGVVAPKETVV